MNEITQFQRLQDGTVRKVVYFYGSRELKDHCQAMMEQGRGGLRLMMHADFAVAENTLLKHRVDVVDLVRYFNNHRDPVNMPPAAGLKIAQIAAISFESAVRKHLRSFLDTFEPTVMPAQLKTPVQIEAGTATIRYRFSTDAGDTISRVISHTAFNDWIEYVEQYEPEGSVS